MTVEDLHQSETRSVVAPAAQEIQAWLATRFGELLGVSSEEIDVDQSLSSYGLGSIQAVSLTGDLEDWLGLQLPATLLWDYSTITSLAAYLGAELCLGLKSPQEITE